MPANLLFDQVHRSLALRQPLSPLARRQRACRALALDAFRQGQAQRGTPNHLRLAQRV